MAELRLTSPAFAPDEEMPSRYRGDGENLSPPLAWEGVPEGTEELVLVCEDPDADEGVLTHWVVFGLPPTTDRLPEGLPRDAVLEGPVELLQGLNEFGEVGYVGPQAREERGPHRIFFRISAISRELLEVSPGATREELRKAAAPHVLARAELVVIG